jgi:hypothetical protein
LVSELNPTLVFSASWREEDYGVAQDVTFVAGAAAFWTDWEKNPVTGEWRPSGRNLRWRN